MWGVGVHVIEIAIAPQSMGIPWMLAILVQQTEFAPGHILIAVTWVDEFGASDAGMALRIVRASRFVLFHVGPF